MTLHLDLEMEPEKARKLVAIITRLERDLYLAVRQMAMTEQRSMNSVIRLLLQRWVAGEIEARAPRSHTRKEARDDDDDSN